MKKLLDYIKGSIIEMKKVTWPSRKEALNYTVLIVIITIAVAIFLGSLDFIFSKILEIVINNQ